MATVTTSARLRRIQLGLSDDAAEAARRRSGDDGAAPRRVAKQLLLYLQPALLLCTQLSSHITQLRFTTALSHGNPALQLHILLLLRRQRLC